MSLETMKSENSFIFQCAVVKGKCFVSNQLLFYLLQNKQQQQQQQRKHPLSLLISNFLPVV